MFKASTRIVEAGESLRCDRLRRSSYGHHSSLIDVGFGLFAQVST